jgi:IS30 family transposase
MSHIQFTRDLRVELATLLSAGKNQNECAGRLGLNRSSISREIDKNKDPDGVYRGAHADKKSCERRRKGKDKYLKIKNNKELREYIINKLKRYWSPEQIAGRIRKKENIIICHETIYTYIYKEKPELVKYLRRQKNKYRRRRGSIARIAYNRASKIRSIDSRPSIVDERSRIGDWEDDTVIGKEKKQRILTKVERKSGFGIADKLELVTAEIVHNKSVEQFKKIPKKAKKTLTRDNGCEFGDYDMKLEKDVKIEVYRAHPYHSWERGSNENWNGLLRQFFPKSIYFATITTYEVKRAVRLINDRPRKRLGYMTPREVFRECCNSD